MSKDKFFKKTASLACILMGAQNADAGSLGWLFSPVQADPNSEFHNRVPEHFQDDITSDQNPDAIKLTPAEQHQALAWGLSDSEEKRYLSLMQNQSGYFYGSQSLQSPLGGTLVYTKKATPVEILGFNARSDASRNKYAELDAQQQIQYISKYLAYVTAYNRAAVALKEKLKLPIVRKFNEQKFSPYNYKPVSLQSGDKLMLFIHPDDEVRPIIASLLGSLQKNKNVSLNVFFVGNKIKKSNLETWARDQNIPPQLVKSQKITLNFGNDQFQLLKTNHALPLLILVRDGNSRFVNTNRF